MRKGYLAEYECKKKLIEMYGKENVLKIAIGGATDFLVLEPGKTKVLKIVEVKHTKKNKWYPTKHDLDQFVRLFRLRKEHKIPVEYWIKIKGKWHILPIEKLKDSPFVSTTVDLSSLESGE